MRSRLALLTLLMTAAVPASFPCSHAASAQTDAMQLLKGGWGGDNVEFSASEKGAFYEEPCFYGEVKVAIQVQSDGSFSAPGSVGGQSGPNIEATFSGLLQGGELVLIIDYLDPYSHLPVRVIKLLHTGPGSHHGPIC